MELELLKTRLYELIKEQLGYKEEVKEMVCYKDLTDTYITLSVQTDSFVRYVICVDIDEVAETEPFTITNAVVISGSPCELADIIKAVSDYSL